MKNPYKELENYLGITIEDDYKNPDFTVEEEYTSDQYSIFIMKESREPIVVDQHIYYYEPSAEEIIESIQNFKNYGNNDYIPEIFISDLDSLLPESEVECFLENEKGYESEEDEDEDNT